MPLIVIAQFMCTSLWFAGNAVMPELIAQLNLQKSDLGYITSSVQFGFIAGTLIYAFFTVADRYNSSKVFFVSAFLGAFFNVLISMDEISFTQLILFRFLTGFFLAGIYPVGMKIAADYFEKGLGIALSFLVGALVLGTALPHLISSLDTSFSWKSVIYSTSILSLSGGLMMWRFVGVGPYKKTGHKPRFIEIFKVLSNPEFRSAAFGYFGHMWELYAFWAFVPIMLSQNGHLRFYDSSTISFQSFLVIAIGSVACIIGGYLSQKFGIQKIAKICLLLSGICCLLSPIGLELDRPYFIVFLMFWGMVVIADSPLLSTLVAQQASADLKGTALTMVNSIGFAITILSIQLVSFLIELVPFQQVYLFLFLGPLFGLVSLSRKHS